MLVTAAIIMILVCCGIAMLILWAQGYTSVPSGKCAP